MFTETEIIEAVKRLTEAEDARVERWISSNVCTVLLSFPDGPDAYTFQHRMVDVSGEAVRLIGYNF